MLNLDGAALDMSGRKFTYDLPKPFGPERGPATLWVVVRPASSMNVNYRAGLEVILHDTRVRDLIAEKEFEKTNDADAFVKKCASDEKLARRSLAELNFDHCVIEWGTDIQNGGVDLEATRENFLALAEFENADVGALFRDMQKDLQAFDKFAIEAETEAIEGEVKN